jgi:hypothetical protein
MSGDIDLLEIEKRIVVLRTAAAELQDLGRDFPAVVRNTARIRASVKMLELNVSDLLSVLPGPIGESLPSDAKNSKESHVERLDVQFNVPDICKES